MDKRITATLQRIHDAYLKEKKKKSISEIKVIDICKHAKINKTTFYRHYRDIYDLADKAENQVIQEMISNYRHIDTLLTEPEAYITENIEICTRYSDLLETVFDQRKYLLISKLEEALVERCLTEEHTQYEALLLKFCMGGASHIITGEQSEEEAEVSKRFLVEVMKKLV